MCFGLHERNHQPGLLRFASSSQIDLTTVKIQISCGFQEPIDLG
jgi:hypothetical protein